MPIVKEKNHSAEDKNLQNSQSNPKSALCQDAAGSCNWSERFFVVVVVLNRQMFKQ